jgi:hypothetical protein
MGASACIDRISGPLVEPATESEHGQRPGHDVVGSRREARAKSDHPQSRSDVPSRQANGHTQRVGEWQPERRIWLFPDHFEEIRSAPEQVIGRYVRTRVPPAHRPPNVVRRHNRTITDPNAAPGLRQLPRCHADAYRQADSSLG